MEMYGGDWLTNAALVGYIRIQRKGGIKPAIKDGHIKISKKDLESFADRYFNAVLEAYMQNSFGLNKESRIRITVKLDDASKQAFYKMYNDFSKKYQKPVKLEATFVLSSIRQVVLLQEYQKDLKKFLGDVQKQFNISKATLESVLNKSNKKIQEKIDDIHEKRCKFIPNSLKWFYFNKKTIGNPSLQKNSSRLDKFEENYVMPALSLLGADSNEGHVTCKMCKQNKIVLSSFDEGLISEGMFSSTMVSDNTFKNFFYNGQSDLFVCGVCELLLLCTWAGFNPIPINARDKVIDTDQIFVNTSDLGTTLEQNDEILSHNLKNDYSFKETIYRHVFKNILLQQQKLKSQWTMDSCFFVELKTVATKKNNKPDFRYFHVGKNVAELFTDSYVEGALENLSHQTIKINKNTEIKLLNLLIDKILSSQSLTDMCYTVCKPICKTQTPSISKQLFNICLVSTIRSVTNEKFRRHSMNQNPELTSKQVYGILKGLQTEGKTLAKRLDGNNKTNSSKSKSFSYVLLEAIRNNNMNKFFDVITKLYITNNMPVPDNMISMLNTKDTMTIQEKSYAFMSGFCSNIRGGTTDE